MKTLAAGLPNMRMSCCNTKSSTTTWEETTLRTYRKKYARYVQYEMGGNENDQRAGRLSRRRRTGKPKINERLRYTRKTHPLHDVCDVVYVHACIRCQFCYIERSRDLWPIQYVANTKAKACTTFTAPPLPAPPRRRRRRRRPVLSEILTCRAKLFSITPAT